jgi:beta-N-acetylhexosaminidase
MLIKPLALIIVGAALLLSAAPAAPAAGRDDSDQWIVNKVRRMTLEDKVGQLFVANVYGESAEVNPVGKLPVRIPAADDPNTILYPYGHGLGF